MAFRQFILKIHGRCNLACGYCYMYEMADQSWRERPKKMAEATVELAARRIGEHVAAHGIEGIELVLHGGEPLLGGTELIRKAIGAVRREAAVPVAVRMQTNAVLLEPRILDVLDELEVGVGVSMDGDAEGHDRHRRRRDGSGSHAEVVRGLEHLTSDRYRHLFRGILATIDLHNDPVRTYEALLAFDPPIVDFLLPHGTWDDPPDMRVPDPSATPYADWLIAIFERWYRAPRRETGVRMFSELIGLSLGEPSTTEALGLSPVALVVVETDGSIEQVDSLKATAAGPATALHLLTSSLDEVLEHPGIRARQQGLDGLAASCRSCPVVAICGGGLYSHRFSAAAGFDNPSVYCPDLTKVIRHVQATLITDLKPITERSHPEPVFSAYDLHL